jgi:hypothetical protein
MSPEAPLDPAVEEEAERLAGATDHEAISAAVKVIVS